MTDRDLAAEVADLKDLFVRRLLEDKAKSRVIDELSASLKRRDDFEQGLVFRDLFKEALVALDRLATEEPTKDLIDSFTDELLEVFRRRGLERISTEGFFNPHLHEVVSTVIVGTAFEENEIVDVQREGYLLGDRVLRPARVIIAVHQES